MQIHSKHLGTIIYAAAITKKCRRQVFLCAASHAKDGIRNSAQPKRFDREFIQQGSFIE
jgi:hypothetical protein